LRRAGAASLPIPVAVAPSSQVSPALPVSSRLCRRRTRLFIWQDPLGLTGVCFTWNARRHRHRTLIYVRRRCSAQPQDGQHTSRPVSYRDWRNATRRMIPVTDWYPRHSTPQWAWVMAFDVVSSANKHLHRCQLRRRAALAGSTTNARNGRGVPCPL